MSYLRGGTEYVTTDEMIVLTAIRDLTEDRRTGNNSQIAAASGLSKTAVGRLVTGLRQRQYIKDVSKGAAYHWRLTGKVFITETPADQAQRNDEAIERVLAEKRPGHVHTFVDADGVQRAHVDADLCDHQHEHPLAGLVAAFDAERARIDADAETRVTADEIAAAPRGPGRPEGVIPNGADITYKNGRGIVRFHECRDECGPAAQTHRYLVHFSSGGFAGTSREVWLTPSDIVPAKTAAEDLADKLQRLANQARQEADQALSRGDKAGAAYIGGLRDAYGTAAYFARDVAEHQH